MTDWSMIICGDWAPVGGPETGLVSDPAGYYGDLLPILQSADLAIVNLEGMISDQQVPPILKDGLSIRMPETLTAGLKVVPFHLACLANNHSFDFGAEGLFCTQKVLAEAGIHTMGAGQTPAEIFAPRIYPFGEARLAVINAAEGEEGRFKGNGAGVAPLDLPRICAQIADLKPQVDQIAVILHAGREYLPVPAPYIRDAYRTLAEAGANLVIGHHPHVSQGMERYAGALIVYSLGNFAFWIEPPSGLQQTGYMIKACFHDQALDRVETWPYRITQEGLRLLKGAERVSFDRELERLSEFVTTEGCLESIWNAYADRWLTRYGMAELGENVVGLIGVRRAAEAILKRLASDRQGDHTANRLARSVLWRGLHWLERREHGKGIPSARAQKAAAALYNRLDTLAHRELYLTALNRVIARTAGDAPGWAYQLVDEWEPGALAYPTHETGAL